MIIIPAVSIGSLHNSSSGPHATDKLEPEVGIERNKKNAKKKETD